MWTKGLNESLGNVQLQSVQTVKIESIVGDDEWVNVVAGGSDCQDTPPLICRKFLQGGRESRVFRKKSKSFDGKARTSTLHHAKKKNARPIGLGGNGGEDGQ